MALFDFLKKDGNKEAELFNPVEGEVIPLEEVSDPVFSQKMMGDGFGVEPANGEIYSPIEGKVVSIFPTSHALGLELANGIEVLVHIGVDTVELEGGPFEIHVSEGENITKDTHLATVDLAALEEAEKPDTVIIVFTNMDVVEDYTLENTGNVPRGERVGEVSSN
jgi:glucose-specific phosphotransferase system IIA component